MIKLITNLGEVLRSGEKGAEGTGELIFNDMSEMWTVNTSIKNNQFPNNSSNRNLAMATRIKDIFLTVSYHLSEKYVTQTKNLPIKKPIRFFLEQDIIFDMD